VLERLNSVQIGALQTAEGETVEQVSVGSLSKGTIVRVNTKSDNGYLFEITEPTYYQAHVIRCEIRSGIFNDGYRGERTISPKFRIEDHVWHDGSRTSPVAKITILKVRGR
jgi:hypothetical protein